MTRLRVLVLTQYYHPEPNFITQAVARALTEVADVTVVTAHPNYPDGRFRPGSRFWMPVRSVEGDAVVWRLPMFPDHSTSILRRGISYLSFAVMAAIWAPLACPRPDVVWVYNTPFTTPIAALWFRYIVRARVVYTAADLWPESMAATGVVRSGAIIRLMGWYSRLIDRVPHLIICVTDGIANRYAEDGVPSHRIAVVRVWVDGSPEQAVAQPQAPKLPRIVYAGNLGAAQPIETILRAAALLEASGHRVQFDIYGAGLENDRLRKLAKQLRLETVTFHGPVSPAEVFAASVAATAQVVALVPSPLFRMTVPSKLYFCASAAAPLLYALEGEAHEIVAAIGGGVPFDPKSAESCRDAILQLIAMDERDWVKISEALAKCYNSEFRKSKLLERYVELLLSGIRSGDKKAPEYRQPRRNC